MPALRRPASLRAGRQRVVDPVPDCDPKTARTATHCADAILAFGNREGLKVKSLLETHARADHPPAGHYLQGRLGR